MTPLNVKMEITSPKGMRTLNGVTKPHNGIDLKPVENKEENWRIYAVRDGVIGAKKEDATRGKYLDLITPGGISARYQHLLSFNIQVGQAVKEGDILGVAGNTGYSTGRHLHYEEVLNGKHIDPCLCELPNKKGIYHAVNKIVEGKLRIMSPNADGTFSPRMAKEFTADTYEQIFAELKTNLQDGEFLAKGY